MGEETKIEWTDHSWSPWRGCTKVSPGCAHCYAETLSKRNPAVLGQWGKGKPRVLAKNWLDPIRWNRSSPVCAVCGQWDKGVSGDCQCGQYGATGNVRKPTIFPSLCDWLDDEVPVEWLAKFLQLIHDTPNLTWLLLTKRPELWRDRVLAAYEVADEETQGWLESWLAASDNSLAGEPPANVWVGTSVEDQTRADQRIPALLRIPAVGRFLSVEPLLGPVELNLDPVATVKREAAKCQAHPEERAGAIAEAWESPRINWVIIGGESGNGARPCNVDWIRSIVRQCKDASVPCFVKQLGAYPTGRWTESPAKSGLGEGWPAGMKITHPKGGNQAEWPEDVRVREFQEGLR